MVTTAGTPQSQVGLPELSLGIIPGFGGTQRLPRLVGVQTALQMMLTSKPLKAPAAAKAGLVDKVVQGACRLGLGLRLRLGCAYAPDLLLITFPRQDKIRITANR